MPTYEYKCTACGRLLEQYQSMKDKPLRKCPACGKNALERQIGTGAAVIFKGSGFYQTDYRSDSYKKEAKADSTPAAPAAADTAPAKPAPSTDAKPAAKPEAKPQPKPRKPKGPKSD